MIRIDAMWLAIEPLDMRAGADRLMARVVEVFGVCVRRSHLESSPTNKDARVRLTLSRTREHFDH